MSDKPTFLVCTMCCGEPDFPHHVEALGHQGVHVEHRVFRDMLEVDAHNVVYGAFNAAPAGVIRAKVDADVVLDPGALSAIAGLVKSDTVMDPYVSDFFTDRIAKAGISVYGDSVRFRHQEQTLKCDRDVITTYTTQAHLYRTVGKHAHFADEWTAFHFGFHRGLKSQLEVYSDVKVAHAKHGDRARWMALRGFELAQSDLYAAWHTGREPAPSDHNYGSPRLRELFEAFRDPAVSVPARTW